LGVLTWQTDIAKPAYSKEFKEFKEFRSSGVQEFKRRGSNWNAS
jgi:hypothetical protein